jgi:hypothetical protein
MSTVADTILAGLEPVNRAFPDRNGILAALVDSLAEPVQIVDDVARDTDTHDAWQAIYDPDACPVELLAWLAQHVGVQLPPYADEAQQRALIGQSAGFYSGTVPTLIHDVRMTLVSRTNGPAAVDFQRHVGGNPWLEIITVREDELVSFDATYAAVQRDKPAGVRRALLTSDAPLIDQGTALIDDVTATIDAATLSDIT